MKNIRNMAVIFSCALAMPGAHADVRSSEHSCYAIQLKEEQVVRVCPTSFPTLWRNTEHYDGKYIQITGYIGYVHGNPYIFASKDLYIYSAGRDGILLEVPAEERDRFIQITDSGLPITISGRFYSERNIDNRSSLGRITVVGKHYWPQEMPGEQPIPPPEQ